MTDLPWWERHQAPLAVTALLTGALVGSAVPGTAGWGVVVEPALALLLLATFLTVPLGRIPAALRDLRFLGWLLVLDFVVVPVVVLVLSRFVGGDRTVLVGVVLVLLAPCVDYVIVFTGLAGGAAERLLAAAPVLLVVQVPAVAVLLPALVGDEVLTEVPTGSFARALMVLLLGPLLSAALVQALAVRHPVARRIGSAAPSGTTPLLLLTLFLVAASQTPAIAGEWGRLLPAVGVFVAFAVLVTALGAAIARRSGLGTAAARALLFSGVTRNSLVVLPWAWALSTVHGPVPAVVVTQTLVELTVLVLLVRWVPRLLPHPPGELSGGAGTAPRP